MWVVEGLTHRYPTKVLAELLSTCPQYCGHCTRMDLVGNDVPQVDKLKFTVPQKDRHEQILDYLRRTPAVRDVVVSGGDIANLHITQLEPFVDALLDIPNIRDIRLASKGLIGIPQHFLQDDVLQGLERLAKKAFERGVDLALHCHANHAEQITPLVGRAVQRLLELGFRDVRNQGVLLRGRERHAAADLVELCFMLLDHAKIMPYYFYMCDMIPNAEHWRLGVFEAQQLQHDIMGYLPGFATPRIVCDVPFVGKRWVHQVADYDRERGHLLLDQELPHRHRGGRAGRACHGRTSTTIRSICCRSPARRGGGPRAPAPPRSRHKRDRADEDPTGRAPLSPQSSAASLPAATFSGLTAPTQTPDHRHAAAAHPNRQGGPALLHPAPGSN